MLMRAGVEEAEHSITLTSPQSKPAVVWADHLLDQVDVSPAAASILGVGPGEMLAIDFILAVKLLVSRALNHEALPAAVDSLCDDLSEDIEFTLHFAEAPTRLRVSSYLSRQVAFVGRVWTFADVSAADEAVAAIERERAAADAILDPQMLLAVVRDGAEQKLEATQGLLRAAVDSMLDPQVLLEAVRDQNGAVLDFVYRAANRAALATLGRAEQNLLGTSQLAALPNLEQSGLIERYIQCLRDGRPVILLDHASILSQSHRYDIGICKAGPDLLSFTWRDVTERFLAAQRIVNSERRYRLLAENSADIVCHVRDGVIAWISPSCRDVLGAPPDYWIGRAASETAHPDDREEHASAISTVLAGNAFQGRLRYIAVDGAVHWCHVHANPFYDADGRSDGYTTSLSVIDDEVAAQQQARESRRQLESELDGAAAYLSSTMPDGLTGEVAVSSRYLPSRALGGDCFNYTWIDDDHLLVNLIDVSGHGIEPALLSVSVHNLLRSGTLTNEILLAPESALAELNRLFQMKLHNDHFFTIWYGVYEASTRVLRYASAGAPPAFAFTATAAGTVSVTELSTPVVPVGVFEDTAFTSATYQVPPGCQILIYSDGASELELAGGGSLTTEDFRELVIRHVESSDWSLDTLIGDLRALQPTGGFEDDCSLIHLKFGP